MTKAIKALANHNVTNTMIEILNEYDEAISRFPKFASPHEGLAIIEEEFEELKAEVFKQHNVRSAELMRKEAKQIATMALRFMVDLT